MRQLARVDEQTITPLRPILDGQEVIHILLVEDEPAEALLVCDMLEQIHTPRFRVLHVTRMREALDTLREQHFDVILLDLSLPDATDLGGVQQMALAAVGIPIIVLTGLDNDTTAVRAMQYGAQDYLIKGQTQGQLLCRSIRYAIERKRADEQTAWLAHFDPLTGLANRPTFRDSLAHAVARARRDGTCVALLFLDLDGFKAINDKLGHHAGDRLLQETAQRLKSTVRDSDIVSRLGGDEFTLIFESLEDEVSVVGIATKIIEALNLPFTLDAVEVQVTPSIGIAVYPDGGADIDTLIRNADAAMYKAKSNGGNMYQFYTGALNGASRRKLSLEQKLTRALEREELEVHYQPKVELRTGRILGAEALLRWRSDEHGVMAPADFIPLAEEYGLINPIGEYVLRRACAQHTTWRSSVLSAVPIAVNVSAKQLRGGGFVDLVASAIADSGIEPRCLELELTESVLVSDLKACRDMLVRLKSMGVQIGIDDFGTGYSSLAYLKRFPLDVLKIDRSFVNDLLKSSDDAAIVDAIIALGHSLGLTVVAEGVERVRQRDYLDSRGCECAQGFLYSQAVNADAFTALLKGGRAPAKPERRGRQHLHLV